MHVHAVKNLIVTYLSEAIRIRFIDAALALAASLNSGCSGDVAPFNLKESCSDAVHVHEEIRYGSLLRGDWYRSSSANEACS